MLEITRTGLLVILGLVAILCVVMPPSYFLWQLKIVVTEFPHILIIVALIIFGLPLYQRGIWIWPQLILMAEIIVLALFPIISAERIAARLPQELTHAFGSSKLEIEPFSIGKLFSKAKTGSKFETFVYFLSAEQQLTLDFYPANKAKAPVVLIIHGGGWDGGDSKQLEAFNSILAERGYSVAAINYSLAPKYQSPRPSQDVLTALEFLKKNESKLDIDANNVVLMGRSAGGQIALQAAYANLPTQVKGVIAVYAPADMIWGYEHSYYDDILKSKILMRNYIGGLMENCPDKYKEASALTHVRKGIPPTLMIHGRKDNMVAFDHNLHLIEKLKPCGTKYYLLDLPWATHGADYNVNGPTGQLSTYAIFHFLNCVTAK